MKIIKILFTTLFLLLSSNAIAAKYTGYIGTSITYANINEPDYEFVNEYEAGTNPKQNIRSINVGLNIEFDNNWFVNGGSNRGLNKDVSRSVIYKPTGSTFLNKTKITTDYLKFGKRFDRYLPSILISNTRVDKKLYSDNILLGNKINYVILFGFGSDYLLTKNISASFYYILPNQELNLESAFIFGINYNF